MTVKDITIHKKISKNFNEYKSKPVSVIIAERKANREGALINREISYIITGRKNNKLDGIEPFQFTGEYDKIYYWDNLLLPVFSRLLKVVFPKIDWDSMTYYSFNQLRLL